jgi:hypothetical protein
MKTGVFVFLALKEDIHRECFCFSSLTSQPMVLAACYWSLVLTRLPDEYFAFAGDGGVAGVALK